MKGYHGPPGPVLGLKSIWLSDVAFPFVNLKKERHFNFLRLVVFNCVYGVGWGGGGGGGGGGGAYLNAH